MAEKERKLADGRGEGGGGGGAKSYDSEIAWFSINHSILSDYEGIHSCIFTEPLPPTAQCTKKFEVYTVLSPQFSFTRFYTILVYTGTRVLNTSTFSKL
jgi:hypothetical protein